MLNGCVNTVNLRSAKSDGSAGVRIPGDWLAEILLCGIRRRRVITFRRPSWDGGVTRSTSFRRRSGPAPLSTDGRPNAFWTTKVRVLAPKMSGLNRANAQTLLKSTSGPPAAAYVYTIALFPTKLPPRFHVTSVGAPVDRSLLAGSVCLSFLFLPGFWCPSLRDLMPE